MVLAFTQRHHSGLGLFKHPKSLAQTIGRVLNAQHAGEELWRFTTNSSVVGVPTSFEVDGVQYVAVESSGGNTMTNVLGQMAELAQVPYSPPAQGGVIWVFALKDQAAAN